MYSPSLTEVTALSETYNLIPVVRRVLADTETPIRVFQRVYEQKRAFLLESVEGGANWARYSFIGMNPFLLLRGKNGTIEAEQNGEKFVIEERPLEALKDLLSGYSSPQLQDLPRFTGGAVGFFGYDLLRYYEKLPAHAEDDLKLDDLQFMFCDQIIVFDHLKQQMLIVANAHIPNGAVPQQIEEAYAAACRSIDRIVEDLQKPLSIPLPTGGANADAEIGQLQSNVSKERFIANVEKAQSYIRSGDIFQVVLSQRFEIETDVSPLHVYRVLRTMNPSPYMYYLKLDDDVIVGASPELLVRVEGERVHTRPIAGTRPRGTTPEHDEALERELLADEKERAEHLMLVDLGRNDIGRVSVPGTVRCDSFMEIERYSHVMHIVSHVSGELQQDRDFYDAFLSCLPAGTVSGAPKLRAMEIIAEMERESRGVYAGAIGYLGFGGNLDTCITIRTIVFKNGKAYVQAGAGIVWDSVPENEYMETVNKAKALLKSIRVAESMFGKGATTKSSVNQDYYYSQPATLEAAAAAN